VPYFYCEARGKIKKERKHFQDLTVSEICENTPRTPHGLHVPLTLDEYCCPNLSPETLNRRNGQQVPSRYEASKLDDNQERGDAHQQDKEPKPQDRILVGGQLWLYRVRGLESPDFIILAFPEHLFGERAVEDTLVRLSMRGRDLDTVALLATLFELIETPALGGLSEPLLNIYKNSIINVENRVNLDFYGSSDAEDHTARAKAGKKAAKETGFFHRAGREKGFFFELSDIRQELSMMQSIIL
jgi:hypothetical protein